MTRFDATDRRPVDKWTAAPRPTTSPQGQKPQQKRSTHMVHKPVNSECSRQPIFLITVFAKNEKGNLSKAEQAAAVELSKRIVAAYGDPK